MQDKLEIILASQSPSRKWLLDKLEIPYKIMPADIDETQKPNETPEDLVTRLATEKAQKIANIIIKNNKNNKNNKNFIIIGCDQIMCLKDNNKCNIFGKPKTHANAVKQLQASSNKWIECYSGMALIKINNNNNNNNNNKIKSHLNHDRLKFKNLSDNIIEQYLLKTTPYECAGAVKYEGLGIALFEKIISEDPNAIIGLPLMKLSSWLIEAGAELFAMH